MVWLLKFLFQVHYDLIYNQWYQLGTVVKCPDLFVYHQQRYMQYLINILKVKSGIRANCLAFVYGL